MPSSDCDDYVRVEMPDRNVSFVDIFELMNKDKTKKKKYEALDHVSIHGSVNSSGVLLPGKKVLISVWRKGPKETTESLTLFVRTQLIGNDELAEESIDVELYSLRMKATMDDQTESNGEEDEEESTEETESDDSNESETSSDSMDDDVEEESDEETESDDSSESETSSESTEDEEEDDEESSEGTEESDDSSESDSSSESMEDEEEDEDEEESEEDEDEEEDSDECDGEDSETPVDPFTAPRFSCSLCGYEINANIGCPCIDSRLQKANSGEDSLADDICRSVAEKIVEHREDVSDCESTCTAVAPSEDEDVHVPECVIEACRKTGKQSNSSPNENLLIAIRNQSKEEEELSLADSEEWKRKAEKEVEIDRVMILAATNLETARRRCNEMPNSRERFRDWHIVVDFQHQQLKGLDTTGTRKGEEVEEMVSKFAEEAKAVREHRFSKGNIDGLNNRIDNGIEKMAEKRVTVKDLAEQFWRACTSSVIRVFFLICFISIVIGAVVLHMAPTAPLLLSLYLIFIVVFFIWL